MCVSNLHHLKYRRHTAESEVGNRVLQPMRYCQQAFQRSLVNWFRYALKQNNFLEYLPFSKSFSFTYHVVYVIVRPNLPFQGFVQLSQYQHPIRLVFHQLFKPIQFQPTNSLAREYLVDQVLQECLIFGITGRSLGVLYPLNLLLRLLRSGMLDQWSAFHQTLTTGERIEGQFILDFALLLVGTRLHVTSSGPRLLLSCLFVRFIAEQIRKHTGSRLSDSIEVTGDRREQRLICSGYSTSRG